MLCPGVPMREQTQLADQWSRNEPRHDRRDVSHDELSKPVRRLNPNLGDDAQTNPATFRQVLRQQSGRRTDGGTSEAV